MYLLLAFVHNIVIPGYKDITLNILFLVLLIISSAFRYMVLSGICMDRPNLRVFCQNDANGVANSEDHEEQSDLGLGLLSPIRLKT